MLGRKQRNQVTRSFPNRYLFSFTNKVTSLFSIRYILIIIFTCKNAGTREKGMRNMLERMQEQVYNDSQTDERNWANLLERIGYNKSSEGQTY